MKVTILRSSSFCPHLLAIIYKLSIKKILHQRGLTKQLNVIVRATINRAACDSLGTNVGMPIKGKLNFLCLVWMQRAVQRKDIKNLLLNKKIIV